MNEKILVPVLGESITEATVAKWLKNEGDSVQADEPIVELETDKDNLEVPSPNNGIISNLNASLNPTCNFPKPDSLHVFDIIDTRVKIGWKNMNSSECRVLKYYVRFREVGSPNWITRSAGAGSGLCNYGFIISLM